jgi:hypothetical protein
MRMTRHPPASMLLYELSKMDISMTFVTRLAALLIVSTALPSAGQVSRNPDERRMTRNLDQSTWPRGK